MIKKNKNEEDPWEVRTIAEALKNEYTNDDDCYMRISIGSRLADSLVISTIQIATVSDCEAAVDARGNGTCMLGRDVPQSQDNFQQDPDFDVYIKGRVSLLGCRSRQNALSNYFSTSLTGFNQTRGKSMTNDPVGTSFYINTNNSGRIFGNPNLSNVFKNSFFGKVKNQSNSNSFTTSIAFPEFTNDDRTRTFDILQNKYDDDYHQENKNVDKFTGFSKFANKPTLFNENFAINVNDENNIKNFWTPYRDKLKNTKNIDDLSKKNAPLKDIIEFPIVTSIFNKQSDFSSDDTEFKDYPTAFDVYSNFGQKLNIHNNFEYDVKNYDNHWWDSRGKTSATDHFADIDTHGLKEIDSLSRYKACFQRIFSGKRIIDAYVRRSMECDTLHECHRMCEYERGFTCEGFNYRSSNTGKNTCELTSIPSSRVDINRDFTSDHRCQFYERDWSQSKCYEAKKDKPTTRPLSTYSPQSSNNWWAADPRPISWNSPDINRGNYSPVHQPIPKNPPLSPASSHPSSTQSVPYGGSFKGNTQLTLEIPRPINPNRRHPTSGPFYNSDNSYHGSGLSDNNRPSTVRPLNTYYHHEQPVIRPSTLNTFHHHDRVPEYGYNRPSNYIPPTSSSGFDGYSGNGYSYGRPVSNGWQKRPNHNAKYPNKRIGYNSDPETNEVGPLYIPVDHRPPLKASGDWDNYGNSYANGYHTNYLGNGPKYHSSQRPGANYPSRLPPPPPPSHNDQHHYGQFYNYGVDYGYSNGPTLPPKIYPHSSANPCSSVRSTSGFKLTRSIVQNSYLTTNVEQCEKLCKEQKDFICRTFAYRYSLASTSPFDNCLLSDAAFENLIFYTDLEPDRDYDIYAMAENSKWCQTHTKTPNPRRPRPPDECFWRVRSGFCMPPSVIKKPIRVDGMGECQVQCVGSHDFICRSFVFRYEIHPTNNGLPNCFLSDWPAMEVEPKDMQDMDGAEFYERGSFGRGCEPRPSNTLPPPLYESSSSSSSSSSSVGGTHNRLPPASRPDDASCYADYNRPCKLTPYAIIYAARVTSEADCRRKCSGLRQKSMAPCMSFNYRVVDDNLGDNCYLSDISMRDLRPGLDFTHDQDYVLYVWRETEPKCSLIFINDYFENRQPNFNPLNYQFDHGHASINGKPYNKPENPYYYEISVPEPNKPGLSSSDQNFNGNGNNDYDERYFFSNIPNEFSVFKRFTVNGQACKRGTRCEKNLLVGYWSCEPEGAAPGDWDYCCEPNHHCGFSQGYNYQWCYVGSSIDQWRPCSDKYYPYEINPRPNTPAISQPSYPRDDNDANHHSRHWPITFLHGEAPPNGTDSVALANDVKDESITDKPSVSLTKVDFNVSSEPVLNHTMKRGVDELIMAINKKRKDHVTVVPLKLIGSPRRNRTGEKTVGQRLNSRFKKPAPGGNVTVNYSPRFSRDGNNGQYYITKKLNVRFPTRSGNSSRKSSGNVAKIERVMKNDEFNVTAENLGNDSVTSASSIELQLTTVKNIKVDTVPVLTKISNETISSNSTKINWKKMKTINKSNN
ncbi:hypothetical protein PV326_001890 [Microctonus aethiopoides]|nr:hypothetical protein PV326_001890 [Microctonus aethiopoides]